MSENKLLANLEKLTARLSEYANLRALQGAGGPRDEQPAPVTKGERWLKVEDFFHDNARGARSSSTRVSPRRRTRRAYYERHRKARLGRGKVEEEIAHLHAHAGKDPQAARGHRGEPRSRGARHGGKEEPQGRASP